MADNQRDPHLSPIEALSLQRQLAQYVAHVSKARRAPVASGWAWSPSVDVLETPGHYIVVFDLAGIEPEHFQLSIDGQSLVVSGRRELRSHSGKARYHQAEISLGEFERTVALPRPVDAAEASAFLEKGLLRITVPKTRGRAGSRGSRARAQAPQPSGQRLEIRGQE
jgi:HSP20 family molecular chaperone IbpA